MTTALTSRSMFRVAICAITLIVVTAPATPLVGAGESYSTPDGRSAMTLISSGELEYRLKDGTILLCKYTEQAGALRVIMTALGTQQVLYFRRVKGGFKSSEGELYLNESGLAELQRQEQLERRQAEAARTASERTRAQQESAKARAREASTVTYKCGPVRNFSGYGTEMISVTDAGVIGVSGVPETTVAFVDLQYLSNFDADHLDGPGIWLSDRKPYNPHGSWGLRFKGPAGLENRDACYGAIAASYERWRARFSTLAKLPSLQGEVRAAAERQQLREEMPDAQALERIRADVCALSSPLDALYTDFSSYYLVDAMHSSVKNPITLDDRSDGPRTADLVKKAIGGIYISLHDFPESDPYGSEYRFSIGQKGDRFSIVSIGKDRRVGGGDDVVFERSRGGPGAFTTAPRGAHLEPCGG